MVSPVVVMVSNIQVSSERASGKKPTVLRGLGRNRAGGREAKQHSGEGTMQSWMDGMVSNNTSSASGEALRGNDVNRGKPEQIPFVSTAEVIYVSEG